MPDLPVLVVAGVLDTHFNLLRNAGTVIGTSVSAVFSLAIALINLVILKNLYRTVRDVRKGHGTEWKNSDALLTGGISACVFRPLFRALSEPWQMYPVGLLFGLGFDTTTEIAVIGKLTGHLWEYVDNVLNSFGAIGFATIFWLGSIAFLRIKGFREV
jgi:high-affinity nickel-transport protein